MEIKVEMALVEMDGEGETLTEDCGGGAGRGGNRGHKGGKDRTDV